MASQKIQISYGSEKLGIKNPPRSTIEVISVVKQVFGVGDGMLYDSDGDIVMDSQLAAGEYTFKPTVRSLPKPATTEDVYRVLDTFWSDLHKSIVEYPKEDQFLREFPACKARLPADPANGWPSLLWHALDQPFGPSKLIMEWTSQANVTLTVLFNVSGSGKTRTLYEIAREESGIFFAGTTGTDQQEGSGDLRSVTERLAELYPTGDIPSLGAAVCIKALLISRFFLLRQLLSQGYGKGAWLFKQVAFHLLGHLYTVTDPWKELTSRLLELIHSVEDMRQLSFIFQGVLNTLKGDWNGPIIFDECQLISGWLENRFYSHSLGSSKDSFLDVLIPSLIDIGFRRFYYAGTGGSMLSVAKNISATLKNKASVVVFHGFGGFTTMESLKMYASSILERETVEGIDFGRVFNLYRGRYRFFVTALERFIGSRRDRVLKDATTFFVDFFEKMCTTNPLSRFKDAGGESSEDEVWIDGTVFGDVERFFKRKQRNAGAIRELEEILYNQMFGGLSTRVNINNPSLSLVQYGLAWMTGEDKVLVENIDKFFNDNDKRADALIRIHEPAVFRALFHYFSRLPLKFEGYCQDRFLANAQGSHVTIGYEFEKQACLMVAEALDGKAPAHFISRFLEDGKVHLRNTNFDVPSIYFEEAKIVKARVASQVVIKMCRESHEHGDDCYTLERYLRDVEANTDTFPTALWTGPGDCDAWHGFRPDGLIFLTNNFENKRRLIPCLLQMKTGADTDTQGGVSSALDSTDLFRWRNKIVDKGINKLAELAAANGLLRLAVFPHRDGDLEKAAFHYFSSGLPSGGRPSVRKRQKVEGAIQPLCGVIGGTNVSLYLKEWLIDSVWDLKSDL